MNKQAASQGKAVAELVRSKMQTGNNPIDYPDALRTLPRESGYQHCAKCGGTGRDLIGSRCGVVYACQQCGGQGRMNIQ